MDAPPLIASDAAKPTRSRGIVGLIMEFVKARLVALVVVTTLVGFLLASGEGGINWALLGWTLLGTFIAAGGANGINQCIEASRDAAMHRTANRPIPSGQLSLRDGWLLGIALSIVGPAILLVMVNTLTAVLAAVTILLYVAVYTPMKVRTSLNTLAGAVVGAIPPVIGWAGVTGGVSYGAMLLAAILFLWQIPHFLALAWLYREDYARGGFVMLPAVDRQGRISRQIIVSSTALLLPLIFAAWTYPVPDPHAAIANQNVTFLAGDFFLMVGSLMTVVFLLVAIAFARSLAKPESSDEAARRLFFTSIAYLPILLGAMVMDNLILGRFTLRELM